MKYFPVIEGEWSNEQKNSDPISLVSTHPPIHQRTKTPLQINLPKKTPTQPKFMKKKDKIITQKIVWPSTIFQRHFQVLQDTFFGKIISCLHYFIFYKDNWTPLLPPPPPHTPEKK